MKITLNLIALICLSVLMYFVSIQSFMRKEFFEGICYGIVALVSLTLVFFESPSKNK
jgi:hypothetical protein